MQDVRKKGGVKIVRSTKEILVCLFLKKNRSQSEVLESIKSFEPLFEEDYEKYLDGVNLNDFIVITDDEYPESFKTLEGCPIVIEKIH